MDKETIDDFEEAELVEETELPPPKKRLPGQRKGRKWLPALVFALLALVAGVVFLGSPEEKPVKNTGVEAQKRQ